MYMFNCLLEQKTGTLPGSGFIGVIQFPGVPLALNTKLPPRSLLLTTVKLHNADESNNSPFDSLSGVRAYLWQTGFKQPIGENRSVAMPI
jgi:hypothetical protein